MGEQREDSICTAVISDGGRDYPAQRTYNLASPSVYALIHIMREGIDDTSIDPAGAVLKHALIQTCGCVGGASLCDLLQRHSAGLHTLRVDKRDAPRYLAALTSITEYNGHVCQIRTLAEARSLAALAPALAAILHDYPI